MSAEAKKPKGKTSTFMKISMAPGVSLKECKDIKREPKNESDYIRTSGGVYRPQNKGKNTSQFNMSIQEYKKLSGTRTFAKNSPADSYTTL